jgi:hypothetical protein
MAKRFGEANSCRGTTLDDPRDDANIRAEEET